MAGHLFVQDLTIYISAFVVSNVQCLGFLEFLENFEKIFVIVLVIQKSQVPRLEWNHGWKPTKELVMSSAGCIRGRVINIGSQAPLWRGPLMAKWV
jgi:hypothetical protein